MRLVIATPFYPPQSGVLGMYAAGLEQAFTKQGIHATCAVFATYRSLPPGLRHVVYFFKLLALSRRADYILALDTWSVGMPALLASKLSGVPLVVRIGGDHLWETYAERTKTPVLLSEIYTKRDFSFKEHLIHRGLHLLVHHAQRLFFTTHFLMDLWSREYHFTSEKAHIIENMIPARAAAGEPRGEIFVSAGRPIALKNYDLLQSVCAELKTRYPDLVLDTRMLPPREHAERLASAYAVIIPSFSEVSSNTAVDAVVHGKPFIMTRDTGTSERLHDCGLFIDTRSKEELRRAIEQLLNPEEYQKLGAAIRAFSFTHTWDDIAREIISSLPRS